MTRTALPHFRSYGNYSSSNYGVHCLKFVIGNLHLWYSYDTPIAFETPATGLVIRENAWGPTTGKHLNWIDSNKQRRISGEAFEQKLAETIQSYQTQEA